MGELSWWHLKNSCWKHEPLEMVIIEECIQLLPHGIGVIIILQHRVEEVFRDGLEKTANKSGLGG